MLLATAATTLVAGALIGATGIGGVLLVPALTQIEGLPLRAAVAASSLAFAFPGVAALWWLRLAEPSARAGLLHLVAGALPGAWIGGQWVQTIQASWLLAGVAALALFSGGRGLLARAPLTQNAVKGPGPVAMALIGLGVGITSALTGTGGPVILVPLLMSLRQPLARTVAAAQVVQLPVAISASSVHLAAGALELHSAIGAGVVLLVGSLVGQHMARKTSVQHLQRLVAWLLFGTGLWLTTKLFEY